MSSNQNVLRVDKLTKHFGGLTAVNACSFDVKAGSITGLIGPNGSGKTTVFNLITGVLRPNDGDVHFNGQTITHWPPHRITGLGLARTFQITRIFGQMTVWENMLVVARQQSDAQARQRATELLQWVNLYDLRDNFAADLSYGQQKLLEFARALMLEPTCMLLDEPFAGINPTMAQSMAALIRNLQQQGVTFLIIDHEMKLIMDLCDWIFVLDYGEVIAAGVPATIQNDEKVLEAYFGARQK